jgi:hypothetical protein
MAIVIVTSVAAVSPKAIWLDWRASEESRQLRGHETSSQQPHLMKSSKLNPNNQDRQTRPLNLTEVARIVSNIYVLHELLNVQLLIFDTILL